jgi:hypothetical protein
MSARKPIWEVRVFHHDFQPGQRVKFSEYGLRMFPHSHGHRGTILSPGRPLKLIRDGRCFRVQWDSRSQPDSAAGYLMEPANDPVVAEPVRPNGIHDWSLGDDCCRRCGASREDEWVSGRTCHSSWKSRMDQWAAGEMKPQPGEINNLARAEAALARRLGLLGCR